VTRSGAVRAPTTSAPRGDDVVRRAQQGDVDAFEAIYRASMPSLYALCRRMTGDEQEARELVQDAFVRAWERLTTFRGQSSLHTWLHRLTVNVVLEHFRVAKRESLRFASDDDAWAGIAGTERRNDTRLDLESALENLPRGARIVFALHLEGYSHDEIAQMTGIAAGTARAQLWRARRALSSLLDQ
jgi:RNA polymerase sigma-70 factor (ECF subfamily)